MKSIIFAKKNGLWPRSPSGNTANTKSKNAVANFTFLSNVPSKIRRNSFVLLLARHRYRELRERGPTGLSINRDFQKPSSRNISESSVFENWPWHETWISDAKSMRASLTYSWQALTYPPLSWIKESSTNEYFTIARHCEIPIMKKKKKFARRCAIPLSFRGYFFCLVSILLIVVWVRSYPYLFSCLLANFSLFF